MTTQPWPTIRQRRDLFWCVDCGRIDGKRKQYVRASHHDALALADELRTGRQRVGMLSGMLSSRNILDAKEALAILRQLRTKAITLSDSARFYIAKHEETAPGVGQTMDEVIKDLLKAKEDSNRRPRTLQTLRTTLEGFASSFGLSGGAIASFTTPVIVDWLNTHTDSPSARAKMIRYLHELFAYAQKHGVVDANPVSAIDKPIVERKTNVILTPQQAKELMNEAYHSGKDANTRRLAILLFAGLRPSEAAAIRDDDLAGGTIHVRSEVSKTHRARYVTVSDNLAAWLCLRRNDTGGDFDRWRAKLCKRLGLTWNNDITRKSFCSYHLALHQNPNLTGEQMGHVALRVLYTNYRVPVQKEDALRYWAIQPFT